MRPAMILQNNPKKILTHKLLEVLSFFSESFWLIFIFYLKIELLLGLILLIVCQKLQKRLGKFVYRRQIITITTEFTLSLLCVDILVPHNISLKYVPTHIYLSSYKFISTLDSRTWYLSSIVAQVCSNSIGLRGWLITNVKVSDSPMLSIKLV